MAVKISKTTRPAAIAGRFYPAEPSELTDNLNHMLGNALHRISGLDLTKPTTPTTPPKALIVPHAGYRYSGEIAASAYTTISNIQDKVSRVVLLGPAHRVRLKGVAMSGADFFETPLGVIPLDVETIRQCASRFSFIQIDNKAHQHEHSLETQLPFIQRCLGNIKLVPFVIGEAKPEQIAQCLEFLWGNQETLILVSSDLSHFLPYAEATQIDIQTSEAIGNLNPDPITYQHACGQVGIRGLLHIARKKKLVVKQLDLRNSGDTSGRKGQVVGYGSYGFYPSQSNFNRRQRAELTRVAWAAIDNGLAHGKPVIPSLKGYGLLFTKPAACFVTLNTVDGNLRGCIGSLTGSAPLIVGVSQNAYKAAFLDARFQPVTRGQRQSLKLEVSVLSPATRIEGSEQEIIGQLRPFIDGLILVSNGKRGTFLPAVWQSTSDPVLFLRQLKRKAGISQDYWSANIEVFRYTTETW